MRTMTYTESRAKYAETLNAVIDDREEVIVTRAGHEPVVIVALDEYESLKETAYLQCTAAGRRPERERGHGQTRAPEARLPGVLVPPHHR
ncbi:type II toxin-antitoxin system Phd/YefM family antitoxin [Streptomyces sp. NPDC051644]|uniref:type II toxin-antitoxin system Phd/YefM family antitoxin n=1 Tax=Streptomyces sp. NPDC051644 TaxID=3365666 RepID=UPI0037B76A50